MPDIKNYVREHRNQEIDSSIESILEILSKEGLSVEFGRIGLRTNYAMIYNESHDIEIVGYTFIKDVKFYKENVGKLKALQQAVARKDLAKQG